MFHHLDPVSSSSCLFSVTSCSTTLKQVEAGADGKGCCFSFSITVSLVSHKRQTNVCVVCGGGYNLLESIVMVGRNPRKTKLLKSLCFIRSKKTKKWGEDRVEREASLISR